MFICVTFPYDQFRLIGKHLQYIRAFPFDHDIPSDFHRELTDAANWVQAPPTPQVFSSWCQEDKLCFTASLNKSQVQKLEICTLPCPSCSAVT
ncbi:plancitoxin-1-like protein [Lates japonicus]|uniref:deoxyribonuclease II n=1 Tax=Lates japonicus TaxID=270547 RepID=A0AAD3MNE5_LATJO|nr:plancitoxin-1-like protein [Lates japonicus]